MSITTGRSGPVTAVIIDGVLYALGASGSSFCLELDGKEPKRFTCLCGCGSGKRSSVDHITWLEGHIAKLVEAHKTLGITKIVCRRGGHRAPDANIAGLPVVDAETCAGTISGGRIFKRSNYHRPIENRLPNICV